jgi:hypothetical protein
LREKNVLSIYKTNSYLQGQIYLVPEEEGVGFWKIVFWINILLIDFLNFNFWLLILIIIRSVLIFSQSKNFVNGLTPSGHRSVPLWLNLNIFVSIENLFLLRIATLQLSCVRRHEHLSNSLHARCRLRFEDTLPSFVCNVDRSLDCLMRDAPKRQKTEALGIFLVCSF